jgi:hypothetical protein
MAEKLSVSSTSPGVVFRYPSLRANIQVTSSGAASKRSSEPVSESTALAPSTQPSQLEKTRIKPGQESVDMSIGASAATNVSSADSTEIQSATLDPKVKNRTDHQSSQSHTRQQVSKSEEMYYCRNCGSGPQPVNHNPYCSNCYVSNK